ncbi:MAG: hypothetical protein EP335_06505 [Alphaproteobacteria bacterium]|nr:MAG: hypothetical protein EP335_06505 [Alphaproteobacteria bacterium]
MDRHGHGWLGNGSRAAGALLRLMVAVCLLLCLSVRGWAGDVYVIDTIDRPESRMLGRAVEAHCPSCGPILYRHMNGDLRTGQKVAEDLHDLEKAGRLSLVIALGKPATRLLADRLEKVPLIYTLVGEQIPAYTGSRRIFALPTDAPVDIQAEFVREIRPDVRSVGVLVDAAHAPPNGLEDMHAGAQTVLLHYYTINSSAEMPAALRRAVAENQALLLLRGRMVVNNDSIRYVLQYTLENLRHTVVYSKPLVDMGFAAALVPRPEAFGRRVGLVAEHVLTGRPVRPQRPERADYAAEVNHRVLQQLEPASGHSPKGQSDE